MCLRTGGILSRRPPRNSHFQSGSHQMTSEISQPMNTTDAKAAHSLKVLDPNRPIREADNPTAPPFVRFWGTADIGGFWAAMVCPLMTHLGSGACIAANKT